MENEDEEMIEFYRNSIQTRNRIKALLKGETKFIYTMDNDVFAYTRTVKDDNEDDCLIIINRSNDYKNIDFDLDYDLLDEISIKYTPGDYGLTLEKEDDKFSINISPKSFMIFKMRRF